MKRPFLKTAFLIIVALVAMSCSDDGSTDKGKSVDESVSGIWFGDFYEIVDTEEWSTYTWNFGDGTPTSNVETPTHSYQSRGIYAVTLTVTDSSGKTGNDFELIEVGEAGPAAEISVLNPDKDVLIFDVNEDVYFEGKGYDEFGNEIALSTFEWNFGDGSPLITDDGSPSHQYGAPGNYTVTFKIVDNGVTGSTAIPLMVGYSAPLVSITEPASGSSFDVDQGIIFTGFGAYNNFIIGMVSEDNDARFIGDEGKQYAGVLSVNGFSVSGTIETSSWDDSGDDYSSIVDELDSFQGGVLPETWMFGTFTRGVSEGAFNLWYSMTYDEAYTIEDLSGEWILKNAFRDGNTLSLTIDSDGSISGQDDDANQFAGTIGFLVSAEDGGIHHNLFSMNLLFDDQELSGLATYLSSESLTDEDTLIFGLSNEGYSISGFAVRGE